MSEDTQYDVPAFLDRRLGGDNQERTSPGNGAPPESIEPGGSPDEPMPASIDALAIVSKYLELRDYLDAQTKLHAAAMAPYHEAMEVLEQAAAAIMRATKQKNLSTEAGTAYQSPGLRVMCKDVTSFHDWVFQYQMRQFLTAHVSKEAVKAHMDAFDGHVPPGLEVEPTMKINFRRK